VRQSRKAAVLFALFVLLTTASAFAETMPLSQVVKGMKGYGLTVFDGNRIEKFDVEIIGVLNNTGPNQDLILAKVDSPVVQRAGVIAGMSGSPIYIDGKVIGALAFAWQFAKEPVAGITPIEEMLKIADNNGGARMSPTLPAAAPRMSGTEFLGTIANAKTEAVFDKLAADFGARQMSTISGARPIAVPLSLSSFSPETVSRFGKYFDAMNFVAVPSGSSAQAGAAVPPMNKNARPFKPGDPIGAVLLSGDFNVAATGTVTYTDGDRVYAFGHPFLDMGEISFPMAQSEIVGVMPSLATSFKFANTGAIVGALQQDRANGIMGVVGETASTIPIELTLDGSGPSHTYHVNMIRHPQLTPLILAMAADSVIANAQKAAGERTVMMDAEIDIKGSAPIHLREGWAGAQARQAIPSYLAVIAGYLMSNEFREAKIESVKLHLRHDDSLKIAKLVEASIVPPANGRIVPGDNVKVRAVLKPFRGESFVETFDMKVPENQVPGNAYLLVGSGTVANQIDFTLVPPDPRTLEQVLAVLERLKPSTDLTVGLYSDGQGAVAAGVYMPSLPPSIRAVVAGDTSNGSQAPVKYFTSNQQAHSLGYIVDGAVKIDIEIKPQI